MNEFHAERVGEDGDDDRLDELPKSLWAALGMPEPEFRDERSAPEIDREVLLRLVRRESPTRTARAVFLLVDSFKSWSDAYADLVVAEYHRKHGSGQSG